MLDSFFPQYCSTSAKDMLPFNKYKMFNLSLKLSTLCTFFFLPWEEYHNVHFAFWTPFAFWKAGFHKIKGREIRSRSHDDLNTTDDNAELRVSPHQLNCKIHL
jgi:hypothetical protein